MVTVAQRPIARQYVPPFRRPASGNVASSFEAVRAEQDSKPGLGVLDSAGYIDFEAELEDLREDMLDREYHARGGW